VKLLSSPSSVPGEFVGGFGVTDSNEAVAAPSGQVDGVEGEVGQVFTAGTVADFLGGVVEWVAAVVRLLACGGGHSPFRRVEPRFDLVRNTSARLGAGGAD
jgi:hypothetical protein